MLPNHYVHGLVISRLDYCNSSLYGVPKRTLNRLQRVQNAAARIITRTSRSVHITPVLRSLHWLPVHRRVEFKLLVYAFKSIHQQAPPYMTEMLTRYRPSRTLRSSNSVTLSVPKVRTTTFGDRQFNTATSKLWNALPHSIRNAKTLDHFRKLLKTHLF